MENINNTAMEKIIKIIEGYDFKNSHMENMTKAYHQNPFLLIIPISEILEEENISKEINKYTNLSTSEKFSSPSEVRNSLKKAYNDILANIIDNKELFKNKNNHNVIKYSLDCLAISYNVIDAPSDLNGMETKMLKTIKNYTDKISETVLNNILSNSKIGSNTKYLNEKIDEIGKVIKDYNFVEKIDPESIVKLYQNPFLLMTIIPEILKEEEIANKIKNTISIVKSVNHKIDLSKAYEELELYNEDILTKVHKTILSQIKDTKYIDERNKAVIEFFLDSIELTFANKNIKKVELTDEQAKIVPILASLNDNLEKKINEIHDELTKEDRDKTVADLLEEYETKQVKKLEQQSQKQQGKNKESYKPQEEDIIINNQDSDKININPKEDKQLRNQEELNKKQPKKEKPQKFFLYNTIKPNKKTAEKISTKTQENITINLDSLNLDSRNERDNSNDTIMTTFTTHSLYPKAQNIEDVFEKRKDPNLKYETKILKYNPQQSINIKTYTPDNPNQIDYTGLQNLTSRNFIPRLNPNPNTTSFTAEKISKNIDNNIDRGRK